jgi:hypothetical protein
MDRVVVTPDGEQPPPLGGEFEESEEVSFSNFNLLILEVVSQHSYTQLIIHVQLHVQHK